MRQNQLSDKLWYPIRGTAAAVFRARELRQELTPSESILWNELRGSKFHGAKFRRQHPIGKYILDFYCAQSKLAIEVDGSVHDSRKEEDDWLQKIIETHGIRFLRFSNEEVVNDLPWLLSKIKQAL
jgi:very-short-patch-repair endonuclease